MLKFDCLHHFACRVEVSDYAEVKGKQDHVTMMLQQNDAQVQLQQNVSYVHTSFRNQQQQQYVYLANSMISYIHVVK